MHRLSFKSIKPVNYFIVVGEATGGTHAIFLAEVQAVHAEEGMPLAYYRGRMGKFVFSPAESKAPLWHNVLQWEDYY
jgi:hypothetical protein